MASLEQSAAITLQECVTACWDDPAFMREYRRLTGSDLGLSRGLNFEIDLATGHFEAQALAFIAFVRETIFDRLEG